LRIEQTCVSSMLDGASRPGAPSERERLLTLTC
jgi:hypothetical protein